jgi:WD40 repeat protein
MQRLHNKAPAPLDTPVLRTPSGEGALRLWNTSMITVRRLQEALAYAMPTMRAKSAALILICLAGAVGAAELPSESQLPGEPARQIALPAESELPAYATGLGSRASERESLPSEPSAPIDVDPPQVDVAVPPAAQELPSESTLPVSRQAPAHGSDEGGEGHANPLAIKDSPDGIPWLRLNLTGHTGGIRAMNFCDNGQRLCTAGDDKALIVWSAIPRPDGTARWAYERTVRWQVRRGLRGRIYAMAASPSAVALAGEGAMGGNGEILLIDPRSGQLIAPLNDLSQPDGQVVVALDFAPSGRTLTSLRLNGHLVAWTQNDAGLWRAATLAPPDATEHPNDRALVDRLSFGRRFAAIAAIDDRTIVAPRYAREQADRTVWSLSQFDAATGDHRPLAGDDLQAPHYEAVTAIAASAEGKLLASADGAGQVFLWELGGAAGTPHKLPDFKAPILSLAIDPDGRRLLVGGEKPAGSQQAILELWDIADRNRPRIRERFETSEPVAACRFAPDGHSVAWSEGGRVQIKQLTGNNKQSLAVGASPPLRVAFPAAKPLYRLALRKGPGSEGRTGVDHVFDTQSLRLDRLNKSAPPADWLPENWLSKGWTVRPERGVDGVTQLRFYQGPTRRAQLPLREAIDGPLRTVCWIPSRAATAPPFAAAVGTGSGEIFIVQTAADGVAPIIRRFRGHSADIASLAVSLDLRYLASGSLDGTACLWPLTGLTSEQPLVQRWGAEFQQNDGELVATAVRPDGSMHFRGVRGADRIVEVSYIIDGKVATVATAGEMLEALRNVGWQTQVSFKTARGRAAPVAFQMEPAWQQLATLYVDDAGEWAYWHPSGYYDASFEGHKLFGWQVNRGLERLPDFFLAAQFRAQLERPRVMSQLLRSGDLESAFRSAQTEPPLNSAEALASAYRLKPHVEILAPRHGDMVEGTTAIRAEITVDAAQRLAPPKAFANGVVAVNRRLIDETVRDGNRRCTYEWQAALPSDARVLIQVAAATEAEATETDQVVVSNAAPPRADSPAKLYLLSIGVDAYQDAQIPKLSTAVDSAQDLLELMQVGTTELYEVSPAALLEERATKPAWRFLTQQFAADFAQSVSPDDLLVIFLSGHGMRPPDGDGYQFITANARYSDVLSGKYDDCLSLTDFSQFADVPCRKLVILNTCHGGAIQPMMHRELKSAVRALQGDMLLTLAASGGDQEAVEGRFARRLLEALGGAADDDRDRVVSFNETVAYVERTVAADSAGDAVRQTPAAGPKELLQYASVPLTRVNQPAQSGSTAASLGSLAR